jgi:uncharacterized protein
MIKHTKFSSYDGKTSLFSLPNTIKLNNPILIAGFPGPGLVGSISINYIIKKLEMHQIICFESEFIVPGVIFMDGKLRHPFRIYSNLEGTICALICEAPIMIHGMHSVVDALAKWAEDIGVSEVFVIEGMAIQRVSNTDIDAQQILSSQRNPIILSSDESKNVHSNTIKKNLNINSLIEGSTTFIGGISGGLLSSCLSHNISCSVIYISTQAGIPDPDGAAITIELLKNTIGNDNFNIDTTELRKEGQFIKDQLSNLIRSIKLQQEQSQLPPEVKQDAFMYS